MGLRMPRLITRMRLMSSMRWSGTKRTCSPVGWPAGAHSITSLDWGSEKTVGPDDVFSRPLGMVVLLRGLRGKSPSSLRRERAGAGQCGPHNVGAGVRPLALAMVKASLALAWQRRGNKEMSWPL